MRGKLTGIDVTIRTPRPDLTPLTAPPTPGMR